mmetsp:Transcript_23053/g.50293  ORF Transcript_23053/g.50293 Transcript_23053/m.50293 type:complete len:726 (-) Transcript_23053:2565-4742(-)
MAELLGKVSRKMSGAIGGVGEKVTGGLASQGQVKFILERVCNVDSSIVGGLHPLFVTFQVEGEKEVLQSTKRKDANGICEFHETFEIANSDPDAVLVVTLHRSHKVSPNHKLGSTRVGLNEIVRQRNRTILLFDDSADVVAKGSEALPLLLEFSSTRSGIPQSFVRKETTENTESLDSASSLQLYEKHIMMVTRGTRGDVQPFVALARGLAETYNYKCTIVTEMRYRDFVLKYSKVSKGKIAWRCSGGDTTKRVDSKMGQWAIQMKSDTLQKIMLSRSEVEFFNSEPAIYYYAKEMKPDVIVYGFTMVTIAMIVSEALKIPLIGFVLQPTSIPSKDYPPILPLDEKAFEKMTESKDLQGHQRFNYLKYLMENNPTANNVNKMRKRRGLPPIKRADLAMDVFNPLAWGDPQAWQSKFGIQTWTELEEKNFPIMVPINEWMFGGKPEDWNTNTAFTDCIFLRGDTVPPLADNLQAFINNAKSKGQKLVVLAFSSMPVKKIDIFKISMKIISECEKEVCVIALVGGHLAEKVDDKKLLGLVESAQADGRLFVDSGAPFGRLFPLMDAGVVHGGLGTTMECASSGIPTIVTGVLLLDQRFWGTRCHEMNIGPFPIHISNFLPVAATTLDNAFRDDSEWAANAKIVGEKLRSMSSKDSSGVQQNCEMLVAMLQNALPYEYNGPQVGVGAATMSLGKDLVKMKHVRTAYANRTKRKAEKKAKKTRIGYEER